jgi:hypothetical protein
MKIMFMAGMLFLPVFACSGAKQPPPAVANTQTAPPACDVVRDRAAIKGMAGTFKVAFHFEETEALAPGYTPKPPYDTAAVEVVEVIEENEKKISLQHVLSMGAHVSKHWRQDWTFEDREILEYKGKRTWEKRALGGDVSCTWTQAVFEVDDTPRYESYARWVHTPAGSEWTSKETWRPLPRREYTKRDDYDVLVAINKHVVTPQGWRHDQTNTKLVLEGNRSLVREIGLNTYDRIPDSQATERARAYLTETGAFWKEVRAEWKKVIESRPRFVVDFKNDGKQLFDHLFPLAESSGKSAPEDWRRSMSSAMQSYVH